MGFQAVGEQRATTVDSQRQPTMIVEMMNAQAPSEADWSEPLGAWQLDRVLVCHSLGTCHSAAASPPV